MLMKLTCLQNSVQYQETLSAMQLVIAIPQKLQLIGPGTAGGNPTTCLLTLLALGN